MIFQRFISVMVLLVAPFVIGNAYAIPITQYSVTIDDGEDIEFAYFSVTGAGGFELTADRDMGSTVNPMLYLFHDSGSGLSHSDYITRNNNGGSGFNSRIVDSLGIGNYVAAVGDVWLSQSEVVNGINDNNWFAGTGGVTLGLNGYEYRERVGGSRRHPVYQHHSAGTGSFTSEVPEPTSIALLGIGLLAAGSVGRRRRQGKSS